MKKIKLQIRNLCLDLVLWNQSYQMGHTVSKSYQIRQGLSERFCFSYLIVQQRSAQAAIVKKTMSRMHPTIRYEDRCNKSSLVSIWKKKKQENENKCKLLALPFVLQMVLAAVVEFLDLHIKISWTKMRTYQVTYIESIFSEKWSHLSFVTVLSKKWMLFI